MKKLSIDLTLLMTNPYLRAPFLTSKDCITLIKNLNENLLEPSLIFSHQKNGIHDKKQRKSKSIMIEDLRLELLLTKKVNSLIYKKWEIKFPFIFGKSQFAKYIKGDFFNWHQDAPYLTTFKPNSKTDRIFTLIIQLNNHEEFEGGEIEIEDLFGNIHLINNLEAGQGIIFPSVFPHRIKKVKKNERKSLTFWLIGAPLVIK
jgi:predicted 2-oxoglutarate/Fe(II)-dependent dioxygenase YbiX